MKFEDRLEKRADLEYDVLVKRKETKQVKSPAFESGIPPQKKAGKIVVGGKDMYIIAGLGNPGKQYAKTDFVVDLNGKGCSANVVSRSVARDQSRQEFFSTINGNNECKGHSECDAIIMDSASVSASPKLTANNIDANLIHEAAIGKIAGEQLIKLMTLGLTEAEAEEQIINGFLK